MKYVVGTDTCPEVAYPLVLGLSDDRVSLNERAVSPQEQSPKGESEGKCPPGLGEEPKPPGHWV